MADERLRARIRKLEEQEVVDNGRQCGTAWAMRHAKQEELRRLALADLSGTLDHDDAALVVWRAVHGKDSRPDPDRLAAFFLIEKSEILSAPFVMGFVEGASCIWEEEERTHG